MEFLVHNCCEIHIGLNCSLQGTAKNNNQRLHHGSDWKTGSFPPQNSDFSQTQGKLRRDKLRIDTSTSGGSTHFSGSVPAFLESSSPGFSA